MLRRSNSVVFLQIGYCFSATPVVFLPPLEATTPVATSAGRFRTLLQPR
jgi:hypothetical protein